MWLLFAADEVVHTVIQDSGSFPQWTNAGAVGILGAIVVWLITKHVPNLTAVFQSESAANRDTFTKTMAAQIEQCGSEKQNMLINFRQDQEAERASRESNSEKLSAAIEKLAESVRASK